MGGYGAGSSAGLDDVVGHTDAATVDCAALVDGGLLDEVEVKDGDVADRVEGVPGDGVGSWPSRRSIPGFLPLCLRWL